MSEQLYIYRWKKYVPWAGRRCRVLSRGKMNSVLVQFEDTREKAIVSRYAVRRVKP